AGVGMSSAYAQLGDRHIQLFDFRYGIQPGTIQGLSKDKQGFLWILSTRAVQRFDGNENKTFKFPKGLTNIFCDNQGRVWVNSSTEIFLFDRLSLTFKPVPVQSANTKYAVGPVFSLPDSLIWVVTNKGFLEYDEVGEMFRDVAQKIPVSPPNSPSSFTNIGSNLYFAGHGQVYRYDIETQQLDSLPQSDVYRIFPVSRDTVIISSWNLNSYWYDFKQKKITLLDIEEDMKLVKHVPFSVRSVVKISPKHFLIGSQEGLFLYQHYSKGIAEMNLFYKGKQVYSNDFSNNILLDEDDFVWFASIDGIGRFVLKGQAFGLMRNKQLHDDMPPGIDNIRQIVIDRPGSMWVATGNGFVRWDWIRNERKLFYPKYGSQTQLSFPSVRGIAWDGRYIILGPSNLGVWLFDPKTETYRRPTYSTVETRQSAEGDFIDHLLRLRSGNTIILGRDNLYLMDGQTYQISFLNLPFAKENNNWAFQGKDGLVWLATLRGMYLLNENLEYLKPVQFISEDVQVRAGFIMKDGRLLFSTNDGVFVAQYDGHDIKVEKYSPYFDDLYVNTLVEDKQGLIWAATDNGIYRYEPATDRLNLFDYTDNVQGFGFNSNSWALAEDGLLFLGGANGINYFKPDGIHSSSGSLNLFIQRVTGGRQDSIVYPLNEVASIPWSQRSLDCQFVCPYYNNPNKLKYRYKLEGSDEDWKYIGNSNHVRFTSLSPGAYTLHLEASINNADWIPSSNSFSFKVLYPFWMTWWFYTLLLGAIALMIWSFERTRNRRLVEKQEELDAQLAINYFS
ncbi:MAG TPA: triple tyrosine motif-containing protein, partial [Saprospiraceae bacterium]|nr:triple tyrosine motif-containing protein [Saprospiraceae bacterium]